MTLLLISDPGKIEGEHELVNELFECGLDYFHLRKPDYSKVETEAYLKLLNPKLIKKVILHSHHGLVKKYNIGGFHFPTTFLKNEEKLFNDLNYEAKKRRLRTGTSVHSLQEAINIKGFDYYFLSPVFDSISKEGYKSSFDFEELSAFLRKNGSMKNQPEIIALGGIDQHNIDVVKNLNFSGLALLGAIWKNFKIEKLDEIVQKFKIIKQQLKNE